MFTNVSEAFVAADDTEPYIQNVADTILCVRIHRSPSSAVV